MGVFCSVFSLRFLPVALLATLSCAFNIAIIHGLAGSKIWLFISSFTVLAFIWVIVELLQPGRLLLLSRPVLDAIQKIKFVAEGIYVLLLVIIVAVISEQTKLQIPQLLSGQVVLGESDVVVSHQDHGNLMMNKSVGGNALRINGRKYAYGFGTHANSQIELKLPANAKTFTVRAGLDDETDAGNVIFKIRIGETVIWQSAAHMSGDKSVEASVNVEKAETITLEVDGNNGISYDHANWVSPVVSTAP